MSDVIRSIILGIVQGLTEFLPISSSGHIEVVRYIFGDDAVGEESLLMTVVLHFGTALSTVVVFRKFIWEIIQKIFQKAGNDARRFALLIIVSMIPAAFVGIVFEDLIESLFGGNLWIVLSMLVLTGVLLFVADRAKETGQKVNFLSAIIIGISQAIAIIPGISRSGATISTSVLLGIDREESARFSFLMVVPLIFGKIAKDLLSGEFTEYSVNHSALLAGFIAAFITGILACTWMIQLVKRSNLKYFSWYCFVVAIIGFIYLYAK